MRKCSWNYETKDENNLLCTVNTYINNVCEKYDTLTKSSKLTSSVLRHSDSMHLLIPCTETATTISMPYCQKCITWKNYGKATDKLELRKIVQKKKKLACVLLINVNIKKDKEKPGNCSRLKEPKDTWQLNAMCDYDGILDWAKIAMEDIIATIDQCGYH